MRYKIKLFLLLIVVVLAITILNSCTTKYVAKTHYYSFSDKKLYEDMRKYTANPQVPESRPIPYRASKDIQIEIFNYNPLREEIIVEDTSSVWFLGDVGKLSPLVIFPKVPDLPIAAGVAALHSTDCDQLRIYMNNFSAKRDDIENAILHYKELLSKLEIIKDDYEYLKNQPILKSADIRNRLTNNFISRLNNQLLPGERLSANPDIVTSRDLAGLEEKYMMKIVDAETGLDKLKKKADALQGKNCVAPDDFVVLYKQFIAAVTEVKDNLRDFKLVHSEKILPAFNKTLLLYDQLTNYLVVVPNFVTRAIPINKDFHTITIYKKDVGKENKIKYDEINIEPTRGFKIDVAGGFFFSGLRDENYTRYSKDSLYTKKYLVNGVPRDTTVLQGFASLYKKDQFPVSFGGMIYLHAHSQNASWINYGGYLGFGALFNDQTRWTGSVGGSLLFGKNQRFCINPGVIIGQVEKR